MKTAEEIDAPAVNREIKDRKIRRYKPAEIQQIAYERGVEIIREVKKDTLNCNTTTFSTPEKWNNLIESIHLVCEGENLDTGLGVVGNELWKAYQNQNLTELLEKGTIQSDLRNKNYIFSEAVAVEDGFGVIFITMSKKEVVRSMY
ncbi:hypothetical protein [Sediminitomix flava]|nr:hypothetical protein [Sediminitomix flava]